MNPLGTLKQPQLCLYLIPITLNMELNDRMILNGQRQFNFSEANPVQLKQRNALICKHMHITILRQMNDLDS